MIVRERHIRQVASLLTRFPVVAIPRARQAGKTTLADQIIANTNADAVRFDLENPADLARLADPRLALADLRGLVVLAAPKAFSRATRACRPPARAHAVHGGTESFDLAKNVRAVSAATLIDAIGPLR